MLTLLMISFVSYGYDQQNEQNLVTDSKTEMVIDKYGSKIVESFKSMTEKLTPIAIDTFEMVVKLQIAKGITYLIPLLVFIIFFHMSMKHIKKADFSMYDWNIHGTLSIIFGVITLISLISTLTFISDAITHLIAPEWYAIKDIIHLSKELVK